MIVLTQRTAQSRFEKSWEKHPSHHSKEEAGRRKLQKYLKEKWK